MTLLDMEDKYKALKNIQENTPTMCQNYHRFCDGLQQKIDFLERQNKETFSRGPANLKVNTKNFFKEINDQILKLKEYHKRRQQEKSYLKKIDRINQNLFPEQINRWKK